MTYVRVHRSVFLASMAMLAAMLAWPRVARAQCTVSVGCDELAPECQGVCPGDDFEISHYQPHGDAIDPSFSMDPGSRQASELLAEHPPHVDDADWVDVDRSANVAGVEAGVSTDLGTVATASALVARARLVAND